MKSAVRPQRACRTRGCCSHLRPGSAHLRLHRPDRDGRHVPLRRQDLHVLLRGHHDGRLRRDGRLADRAAGAARQARRQDREGQHPVPAPAPLQGRRGSLLEGSARACAPPPGPLGRDVRRRAPRPGHPGLLPHHRPDQHQGHRHPRGRSRSSSSRARSPAATSRPASPSSPTTSTLPASRPRSRT